MNWGGLITSGAAAGFVAVLMQFRTFLRERDRKRKREEVALVFVKDMATNHLPHIYHALRQIAQKQGVELEEPPQIQFLELNGEKGH